MADGSRRHYFADPRTGRKKLYKGQLSYQDTGARPPLLRVLYEDGDSEPMELKEAQRLVLPADEPAPAKMLAMAIIKAAASLAELPARWNLAGPAGLGSALQLLMSGEWDSGHLSVVTSKIRDAYAAAADAGGQGLQ
jgi:hypothetical protein